MEVLKCHFQIHDEAAKKSFIQKIFELFRDKKHAKAVEYLEKWGQSFWEETEYRIKELTTTLEDNLKCAAEGRLSNVTLTVEGARNLTETQKADLIQRAQRVVNEVQIRQLSEILDLVNDVLGDGQKHYYIVIDGLDENWVEERLRFRLIRALIETAKDFCRIRSAKVVLAIRLDLLERVFRLTRDAGFQEEKYESLYLPLEWTKPHLTQVLDTRVNHLIQSRFTSQPVSYADILPRKINDVPAIDYLLARTMMRPRDIIVFFNYCIQKAIDRPQLTAQMIREAEGEYSRDRLRSLADEWVTDYPNIIEFTKLLLSQKQQFPMSNVSDLACQEFALNFLTRGNHEVDELSIAANQLVEEQISPSDFRRTVFYVLYRVGLVGVKAGKGDTFIWTTIGRRSLSRSDLHDEVPVRVHPIFWRVLHIKFE